MSDARDRTAYEILEVREDASQIVIDAAYRALASQFHPDRNASSAADRRMVELNRAYALIRTTALRQAYDRAQGSAKRQPTAAQAAQPTGSPKRNADVIDFGRYAGWSLSDLARHDPDYLVWLSRHSSGIRYRQRITDLLAGQPTAPAAERARNR